MKTDTKYLLQIKTNQYVGNFNRELCAYVFGSLPDYQCHEWIQTLSEKFTKEEEFDDDKLDELYNCLDHFHDEHGVTICSIMGGANSLQIHFSKNPEKYMDMIKRRLETFPKANEKSQKYATKNIKILGVTLVTATTTYSEKTIL